MHVAYEAGESTFTHGSETGSSLEASIGDGTLLRESMSSMDKALLSDLEKSEIGRQEEAQTFINAVSTTLSIGINDLSAVAGVAALTGAHDAAQRKAERVRAAKQKRQRQRRQAGSQGGRGGGGGGGGGDDADTSARSAEGGEGQGGSPRSGSLEGESQEGGSRAGAHRRRGARPRRKAGDDDIIHETLLATDLLGSPRGRGRGAKGTAGPRKWRVADVGRGTLPPFTVVAPLSRLEDFTHMTPERRGFGPGLHLTAKSAHHVDPYDVQRDALSGWQAASPFTGAGRLCFTATARPMPWAPDPDTAGTRGTAPAGRARARGQGSRRQPPSAGTHAGTYVGAHDAPCPWYPGSGGDHRNAVAWHRDHGPTEALEGAGRAATAGRAARGRAVAQQHAERAKAAVDKHEAAREERDAAKATVAAQGERAPLRRKQLEAIDKEIARLGEKRTAAAARASAAVEARRAAAAKVTAKVAAFRAGRAQAEGALAGAAAQASALRELAEARRFAQSSVAGDAKNKDGGGDDDDDDDDDGEGGGEGGDGNGDDPRGKRSNNNNNNGGGGGVGGGGGASFDMLDNGSLGTKKKKKGKEKKKKKGKPWERAPSLTDQGGGGGGREGGGGENGEGGEGNKPGRCVVVGLHRLGRNPLPLASPYVHKASDLFKTFRDDERLY